MVIARFNRTLAIGFFLLLIAAVVAIVGFVAWAVWDMGPSVLLAVSHRLEMGWTAIFVLVSAFFSIVMIGLIVKDSRAIWIENGELCFYTLGYSEFFFFLADQNRVQLASITGLSHVKSEFPGAVERFGIYVDEKSGKSHKVLTFLLRERKDVVMMRLHEALGLPKPSAEVLQALKF